MKYPPSLALNLNLLNVIFLNLYGMTSSYKMENINLISKFIAQFTAYYLIIYAQQKIKQQQSRKNILCPDELVPFEVV